MTTTERLTIEQFLALPDTKPGSEYINGEVVQKPMPNIAHTVIQHLLSLAFGLYLRTNPIGIVGPELRCIFGPPDDRWGRLPDFMFIAMARLAGARADGPFHGAPDLAVEILSPDDRMTDVIAKVQFYLTYGTRLVWLVNPTARNVMVWSSPDVMQIVREDRLLDGGDLLPGFSVAVRDILPPVDLLPG